MRIRLIVLCLMCCLAVPAAAQVSFGFVVPGLSIGINLPTYPQLVRVPGYPVYYAPQLDSNFFFYDGMYWVYQSDNWYASTWYNGPWGLVAPEAVPLYVLRVPVRYYRAPPPYFRAWYREAPPRWGEYWGPTWEQRHAGWNRWNRNAVPPPAPVPYYQREYYGNRYPHERQQQQALHNQHYRYSPQDPNVRHHYPQQGAQGAPVPRPPGTRGASPPSGPVNTGPAGTGKREPGQDG